MKSNLSIFYFATVFLVSDLRNHYLTQDHKDLHLYFFSKSFAVFALTFKRPLNHFQLIFVNGVR